MTVTLLYTGGRPVTKFLITYRIVNTTGWKSLLVATNHSNSSIAWNYSLTDLKYDQHGYEVGVAAVNFIGKSYVVASSPVELFTGLYKT